MDHIENAFLFGHFAMRILLFSTALALVAVRAFSDQTEGSILAFDWQDHTIVLTDHTVWQLPLDMAIPANRSQSDRVYFEFISDGDNGVKSFNLVQRLAVAQPVGSDGGS